MVARLVVFSAAAAAAAARCSVLGTVVCDALMRHCLSDETEA